MASATGRGHAPASNSQAVSPLKLIFLGGLGRSGSTIVGRLLGEFSGVCAVGEVVHLWQRGIVGAERCGCGEPFPDCPFWRKVGDAAFDGWHNVDVDVIRKLRASVDRMRFIPVLARPRLSAAHRSALDEYLSYYLRVYGAIAEVSGCPTVVDSSKNGSLAFCLRWSAGLDLRVVHIVRDPRAVAYSWTRPVARPDLSGPGALGDRRMWTYSSPAAATQWNVQNGAMQLLARCGTPVLRVRYEDFARAPETVLARIASFAALPGNAVTEFLGADGTGAWADLSVSHTVSGNPARFSSGRVAIRPDERWRSAMPASQRRVVAALTLPLLARYGYARRAR
jgi:Sulfotransferase domain